MGRVAIITDKTRQILTGRRFQGNLLFCPEKNASGKWVISEEEINMCDLKEFEFLKKLKLTKHKPVKYEN